MLFIRSIGVGESASIADRIVKQLARSPSVIGLRPLTAPSRREPLAAAHLAPLGGVGGPAGPLTAIVSRGSLRLALRRAGGAYSTLSNTFLTRRSDRQLIF